MNKQLFACIDLGTNTFHLLIGHWTQGKLEVTYRERHFVKVASDGIKTIGKEPFQRALAAAEALGNALAKYKVAASVAFGTAALRTALNGERLKTELEKRLRIPIQIIDGQREAGLISKGVLAAGLPANERYLIMDIGGGSVEFIVVEESEIRFSESYPIGAQVLRQGFHTQEPFRKSPDDHVQEDVLFAHLTQTLENLKNEVGNRAVLVGASGTFDVIGDLYGKRVNDAVTSLPATHIISLYEQAAGMNDAQRFADPRLPDSRADMIVVALALIVHVLRMFPQDEILTCDYALKEGALLELAEQHASRDKKKTY